MRGRGLRAAVAARVLAALLCGTSAAWSAEWASAAAQVRWGEQQLGRRSPPDCRRSCRRLRQMCPVQWSCLRHPLQAQDAAYERARASYAATGNAGGLRGPGGASAAGAAVPGGRAPPPPPLRRPGAAAAPAVCTPERAALFCQSKPAVDRFYAEVLAGCTCFYRCTPSGTSYKYDCQPGLLFNEALQLCDWCAQRLRRPRSRQRHLGRCSAAPCEGMQHCRERQQQASPLGHLRFPPLPPVGPTTWSASA